MSGAADLSAVLLAAGSSRRFGAANKLLAALDGKPLIRHGAEVLAGIGFAELIVVTGPDADAVQAALAGLDVRFVHNARFLEGMGGSVATGIRAVAAAAAGALITPGDMPRLDATLIGRLVEAFDAGGAERIVYPCLPDGSQRNPVIWPRRFFSELASFSGEAGAKAILRAHADAVTAVPASPESFVDIDTEEDLGKMGTVPISGTAIEPNDEP